MTHGEAETATGERDGPIGAGTTGLPEVVDAIGLLPVVGPALQYLLDFLPQVSLERARQTTHAVLKLIDRDDEWLLQELQSRPRLAHFLAKACRAWAADTDETFHEKRAAYRATLQRGVIDDAVIDHEMLRLEAIGAMSHLDLRVVQIIENELVGAQSPVVRGPTVLDKLSGDVATAQVVLGHLERLMVIQAAGRSYGELQGEAEAGIPLTLRFTVFGSELLADLRSNG